MLDAFIIEELRRREREQNRHADDNRLRLPVPDGSGQRRPESRRDDSDAPSAQFPLEDARDPSLVDFTL